VAVPLRVYLSGTREAKIMCIALEEFVLIVVCLSSIYVLPLSLLDMILVYFRIIVLVYFRIIVFFLLLHYMWCIAMNTQ